jgi:thiol-disulfide isomerase/thioredoxin
VRRGVGRLGLVAVVVIVVAALLALVYGRLGHAAGVGTNVGERPPAFTLQDVAGRTVSLKDFAGRPLVLNFFASWCGPCRAETPLLVRYARAYRGRVDFVGIDLTASEQGTAPVASFIRQYHVPYPVLLDTTGRVAVSYMVASIPVTFVIDRTGIIRAVYRTALPEASFAAALRSVAE